MTLCFLVSAFYITVLISLFFHFKFLVTHNKVAVVVYFSTFFLFFGCSDVFC